MGERRTPGDNMKVYVVTQGEYSGYHIERVFADRSKAEAYCKMFNKPKENDRWASLMEIEEYDTADDTLEEFKIDLKYIYSWSIEDGHIKGGAKDADVDFIRPDNQYFWERTEEEWFRGDTKVGEGIYYNREELCGKVYKTIYVVLPTIDAEKAFKIACDKWAELKAEEQGII